MARLVALAVAASAALAMAAPPVALADAVRGGVVSSGAAVSASPGYVLHSTVGQPVVGLQSSAGGENCAGYWCFGGVRVLAAGDAGGVPPGQLAWGPPVPNPARGPVAFALELPSEARVSLSVFDVAGRQVGGLVRATLAAGRHRLAWEPARAGGRRASPGLYFARLEVEDRPLATRSIVLLE